MSEFDPGNFDLEINALSAEGRWLQKLKWCNELLKKTAELEAIAKSTQKDLDIRSYKERPVVDVFEQHLIDTGMPTRRIRLAPVRSDITLFDINEVVAVLPIYPWVKISENIWRLVFLRITTDDGDKSTYMVTDHSFKPIGDAITDEQLLQMMRGELGQPAEVDLNVSVEELDYIQSLREIVCEPVFGYGISTLPPLSGTEE